ncbi:AraC family transcriptional regulator [Nocardia mexicana]|uniref:Helix-turn-helix protein n=1 Tax=Nocardia mexicana TaxID=279262 RepID=A0A370GJA2_9NOCA|nr:helix-turn-helix domain-containing protein [Nocardia mexicana]RDI42003.1 helix-turn-helix protein [Nocardia mexicana]
MPPAGETMDWARVDVAVPRRSAWLPGVRMAGFRTHAPEPVDIAMVPHPALTVLLDLSDGGDIVCDTGGRCLRGSFVAGILPGELRTRGRIGGDCLQVRLSPVTAAAVLGAAAELSGNSVALEEVWGRDAERLRDRLRATSSWDDRFAIVADTLRARLATPGVDPEVAHVWRRTRTGRGRVRVDGLADEVGWSRKRLWSRYRSQLGITPKRAAQLIRFDHAAHLLATGHSTALVAAACGYADQSHLHRETRALAGVTPPAIAAAPWLAIDPVAWPARSRP